ncbi:hypothetical protein FQN57_000002 [Myotisia sp. PD_48]|nr:hypothetical protein FQN57_000002 [Myotisia sp. PD_48]
MYFFKSAITLVLAGLSAVQAYDSEKFSTRYNLTQAQFQQDFNKFVGAGYRLNYVTSAYASNATYHGVLYASIWEKRASPPWTARTGLTSAQYAVVFSQLRSQGYHPVVLNGYNLNGSLRYDTIWEKSPVRAWEQRRDMTTAQFNANNDRLKARGYRLTHISAYSIGSGVGAEARYAAIWEQKQSVEWFVKLAESDIDPAGRDRANSLLRAKGYKMVQLSTTIVGIKRSTSSIWEKGLGHGWLDQYALQAQRMEEIDEWYYGSIQVPRTISAVQLGKRVLYSGLWEDANYFPL